MFYNMLKAEERRSPLSIMVDILRMSIRGAMKTEIVNRSKMNSRLLRIYLKHLVKEGRLKKKGDIYVTTKKGLAFIEA